MTIIDIILVIGSSLKNGNTHTHTHKSTRNHREAGRQGTLFKLAGPPKVSFNRALN